jgi:hypothetical protein
MTQRTVGPGKADLMKNATWEQAEGANDHG